MAKKFFDYELYKNLKDSAAQYKWLEKMYYQLLETDIVKHVNDKLGIKFIIDNSEDMKDTYGTIVYTNTYDLFTDGRKVLKKRTFQKIKINLVFHANKKRNLAYLIDTFAHEIAHIIVLNHTNKHTRETNRIKKELVHQLKINTATKTIEESKFAAKKI